jgi:hypothetical protein
MTRQTNDRIVQSLWIGDRLPPMQQLGIQSFLDHGHEFHLYAYDHIAGVPAGATVCDGTTVFSRDRIFRHKQGFGAGSYSTFSNLFRYQLLLDRGGWWVDTDLICLRPFDFAADHVFATELEGEAVLTATCAFKCPADAPFLAHCLEVALSKNPDDLKWSEIGPYLFDQAVSRFDLGRHRVPPRTFNPINTWEFDDIVKPGFDQARLDDSHGLHLWNQVWKHEQRDPDRDAHPDSLYAQLRRRHRVVERMS